MLPLVIGAVYAHTQKKRILKQYYYGDNLNFPVILEKMLLIN